MNSYRQRADSGFTVIEVVMVLAIIGIMLAIMLQAILMLMRNSHNSRRKNDAGVVLEAVSKWELNHSGNIPNPPADDYMKFSSKKLSYYDPGNINVTVITTASNVITPIPGVTDPDIINIQNHAKCTSGGGATNAGAGYNDVVALYAIETGTGTASKCQEL